MPHELPPGTSLPLDNRQLAARLEEVAAALETRDDNPFRVRSYRNAAETLRSLDRPAHDIALAEGADGLAELPTIGDKLAGVIEQLALTGSFPLLDEIRGRSCPEKLIATVGGLGVGLAKRIHEHLGICSLEELEAAVLDGRLAQVPGLGAKRLRSVRDALVGRRVRYDRGHPRQGLSPAPSVAELLEVDRLYRERAGAGALKMIAPQRLNPSHEAWLPVMTLRRKGWRYRVLYSNTPQAHRLGKTHDWVVIYFSSDDGFGQSTVITAGSGPLKGRRVVRGREPESARYYGDEAPKAAGVGVGTQSG